MPTRRSYLHVLTTVPFSLHDKFIARAVDSNMKSAKMSNMVAIRFTLLSLAATCPLTTGPMQKADAAQIPGNSYNLVYMDFEAFPNIHLIHIGIENICTALFRLRQLFYVYP